MKALVKSSFHLVLPLLAHWVVGHPHFENWLAKARKVLGPQAQVTWLMDLPADDADVHVSPQNALVIVQRDAGSMDEVRALLHDPIIGTGGTRLHPIARPDTLDGWLHATYTGQVQGIPVVVDHFLTPAGETPGILIRVIRAVHGSAPMQPFAESSFLRSVVPEEPPTPEQGRPSPQRNVAGMDSIRLEQL